MSEVIRIKTLRYTIPTYIGDWDGKTYDAPMSWWSEKTGTSVPCMCARRKAVRQGIRNYTEAQILGLEPIKEFPIVNKPTAKKILDDGLIERHKSRSSVVAVFLRTKLVSG